MQASLNGDRKDGEWFLTSTGKQFWPLSPRVEDFDIRDIAHALASICRFGGHARVPYTVAQHSHHVSRLCAPRFAFVGLMHDATEAYVGDLVRPLKYQIPKFLEIEDNLWKVIALRYNLPAHIPVEVKLADDQALMTERRDLVIHTSHIWSVKAEPDPEPIQVWSHERAKQEFLDRFYFLQSQRVRT